MFGNWRRWQHSLNFCLAQEGQALTRYQGAAFHVKQESGCVLTTFPYRLAWYVSGEKTMMFPPEVLDFILGL